MPLSWCEKPSPSSSPATATLNIAPTEEFLSQTFKGHPLRKRGALLWLSIFTWNIYRFSRNIFCLLEVSGCLQQTSNTLPYSALNKGQGIGLRSCSVRPCHNDDRRRGRGNTHRAPAGNRLAVDRHPSNPLGHRHGGERNN